MTSECTGYYASPIGLLEIVATSEAVVSVRFVNDLGKGEAPARPTTLVLEEAIRQLDEYFQGKRREFELSYDFRGTPFQKRVWQALLEIPYGQTISYQELAAAIGNHKAVRAVGHANGRNPISIMAPCHRVIGKNGHLTGYGGGLERKEWLLNHERR